MRFNLGIGLSFHLVVWVNCFEKQFSCKTYTTFYQKPAGEIKTFFVNFLKLRNGDDCVTARLQPA